MSITAYAEHNARKFYPEPPAPPVRREIPAHHIPGQNDPLTNSVRQGLDANKQAEFERAFDKATRRQKKNDTVEVEEVVFPGPAR